MFHFFSIENTTMNEISQTNQDGIIKSKDDRWDRWENPIKQVSMSEHCGQLSVSRTRV